MDKIRLSMSNEDKIVNDSTFRWFVVRVSTGYEEKVKNTILLAVQQAKMTDGIGDCLVPTEEIIEMKLKASSARSSGNTGRELSEEWKENIGKSSKKKWEELKSAGYNHSDKIGGEKNGMYGRKHSEESRRKMSEAVKERVSAPDYISPNKGVARTEEQKKKQSESMKGKPAWNKGVERTEEDKRKVSEGHKKLYAAGHINHFKGKTHSPETKAKMKAYWAKRREGLN